MRLKLAETSARQIVCLHSCELMLQDKFPRDTGQIARAFYWQVTINLSLPRGVSAEFHGPRPGRDKGKL
jgi:hypothetical protein